MPRKNARPAARKALAKLREKMFLIQAIRHGRHARWFDGYIWQGIRISALEIHEKLSGKQIAIAERRRARAKP